MRLFEFLPPLFVARIGLALPVAVEKRTATPRALPAEARAWKGDFDAMIERRHAAAVPLPRITARR